MPASRFIVSSNQAAIGAARLGWGYTRTLSYQVAEAVARGELELVLEAFEPPAVPVHIIYQGGAPGLGQGTHLRRLLRRELSSRPGTARGWDAIHGMSQHREMQVFLAVAQAGSLAAAARVLQLSQATVTRSVTRLEQRLDSTLLLRGPRGVSLSPAGARFADSCQRILQRLVLDL